MKTKNLNKDEMLEDIKQMIVLISAFTKEKTEGEYLLEEWKEKYYKEDKSTLSDNIIKEHENHGHLPDILTTEDVKFHLKRFIDWIKREKEICVPAVENKAKEEFGDDLI